MKRAMLAISGGQWSRPGRCWNRRRFAKWRILRVSGGGPITRILHL